MERSKRINVVAHGHTDDLERLIRDLESIYSRVLVGPILRNTRLTDTLPFRVTFVIDLGADLDKEPSPSPPRDLSPFARHVGERWSR